MVLWPFAYSSTFCLVSAFWHVTLFSPASPTASRPMVKELHHLDSVARSSAMSSAGRPSTSCLLSLFKAALSSSLPTSSPCARPCASARYCQHPGPSSSPSSRQSSSAGYCITLSTGTSCMHRAPQDTTAPSLPTTLAGHTPFATPSPLRPPTTIRSATFSRAGCLYTSRL